MYLLDTDTLTYLYAGHPRVTSRLQKVNDTAVGTTIITKIEVLRGRMDAVLKADSAERLLYAQQLWVQSERRLDELIIVALNQPAVAVFERLNAATMLRKVGRADLLIGSIALANRATLVTLNRRHFEKIPGLKLENWVD
ncbi:MAG: hypothetical protein R3C14_30160 [Caldilineaceae bacterium]